MPHLYLQQNKLIIQKFFFNISKSSFCRKIKFNLRASNSKWNLLFHGVELVTQKKNFYKNPQVNNFNFDVNIRKLML